uniref:Crinkler effector protein N-terminal domain-containing protein n=1 Tax=Peronospora matthiolae TaxID=2874970 RepID=A0AAV1TQT5_9STRA
MGHVTLFYAIVGGPQSIFSVRIDTNRSLGHLKNTIKAEKPSMIHCDVIDMQLFLTKRDGGHGAWMTEEVVQQGVTETKELHRLNTITARLSSCGLSEQDVQTQSTANPLVHVLVVVSKRCWPPVGCVTVGVTQYMRVNPAPLVAFWNAIKATSTKIVANDAIALPEETNYFDYLGISSIVYVRHCYLQLWEACSDTFHGGKNASRRVIILGNEGIGKTHFGFFVLLCLARRGATVVYEKYRASGRYLFSNDLVIDGLGSDFDDVLEQPNTFYVVDDVKPAQCEAKTILVAVRVCLV